MRARAWIASIAACAAMAAGAERWKVQYHYDVDRSRLSIDDLVFLSEKRGVAIGTIFQARDDKPKYTTLVTADGGDNWTLNSFKEHPRSLFFLDEAAGWLVTDDAIWFTEEAGRSWKRLSEQPKAPKKSRFVSGLIERVWFVDRNRGFAGGFYKSAFETNDGGKTWKPIAEAETPNSNPLYTVYTRLTFTPDKTRGMILGAYSPPRPENRYRPNIPNWMEPEVASKRRQVPNLTMLLESKDSGAKWVAQTAPLLGTISALRLTNTQGVTVFQFNESFEWPAEVYHLNIGSGKSERVYREKNRRVMDALLFDAPTRVVLAAIEPPGKLTSSPIPGKVKMITSDDFVVWREMDVDYKAEATRVKLAGPDRDHLWVATDTGMILKLVK